MGDVKPWVWAWWAFTMLFCTLFAVLCWFTWGEFHNAGNTSALPSDVDRDAWDKLFAGAAASAFFALVLAVLYVVYSVWFMVLTRKDLAHSRNRYGKGFMTAVTLYTGLHICNISTHFLSFKPAMDTWSAKYNSGFHNSLLVATVVFGYFSFIMFLGLTITMACWKQDASAAYANEMQLNSGPSSA